MLIFNGDYRMIKLKLFVSISLIFALVIFNTAVFAIKNQSPTLQKIIDDGVLKVGITTTVPSAWKDAKTGEWTGFHVQMGRILAEKLNVKIEFIQAAGDTWIPLLQQGKYDIHMLGWFMTVQRAIQVDFTIPVYFKGYSVVVRKESPIQTIEEINDSKYTVTGVVGGAEKYVADQYFPNSKRKWVRTDNPLNAALEVRAKRADAWIYPSDVINAFIAANPWARLVNEQSIWKHPLGYVIRKGDPEWKFFLDTFVTFYKENGTINRLAKEYSEKAFKDIINK